MRAILAPRPDGHRAEDHDASITGTRRGAAVRAPTAVAALVGITALVGGAALAGCGGGHHDAPFRGALRTPAAPAAAALADVYPAAPPPFSPGAYPCSRCHGTPPAPDAGTPVFPHAVHLDKGLECADCHEDDAQPVAADREMCDECHEPGARGSERAEAYFADLGDAFPRRWEAQVTTAAHDRHLAAGVPCASCHGVPTDGVPVKPGSALLMETCTACHAERGAPAECATCHEPGIADPHAEIVLRHAADQRGCLDCHDATNRDVLHLANGTPVPFEESYRLCGQCHGTHLRDWKLGIHGKRMGEWNGRKEYLLCAHCHDPHSPAFRRMTALPPPPRPKEIR